MKRFLLLFFFFCHIGFPLASGQGYFKMPAEANNDNLTPGVIIFKMKPAVASLYKSSPVELESFEQTLKAIHADNPARVFPFHSSPEKKYHDSGQPLSDLSLIYQVKILKNENLEEAINRLYLTGLVEYAQPRYIPYLFYSPDDPMTGSQYYLERIQAYDAWDISQGDSSVVIAITDTGIDLTHPDLMGAINYNYNDTVDGEDSDNDGFIDNFNGWNLPGNNNNTQYVANAHGVHVAGIAAAQADNGTGIAGVGFNSRLLPIKIDDELGRLVMAYEGIVYAADQGAKVINCSWGGSLGAGQFGQDIVNYAALNCDAVVIGAAGNSDNQVPVYPASYQNVMSVAATDIDDIKWVDSSYGINVDVSAPGANILSTWPGGNYVPSGGTSMAAPVVSGAAALLRDYFPDYSALQVMAQLKVTSDIIDTIEGNNEYQGLLGAGRINLFRALTETDNSYIQMIGHELLDEEFSLMEPGEEIIFSSFFQNLLAPADNITATLSSESPHVEITHSTVNLGPINTNEIVHNTSDPFQLTLLSSLPASHRVVFSVIFTNESGEYAGKQLFSILFNVDYVNIQVNDLTTTITSRGTAGYNYPDFSQGNGFIYKNGESMVKNAGLIIGASSSKVVDNVYGATEDSFNQFFLASQNAHLVEEPDMGDTQISGIFSDDEAGVFALGLDVDYSVFFWHDEPHKKYMIMEYKIINKSQENYSSLYAGFFSDWVLRDNKNHRAAFDAANRMGYAWSAQGANYSGLGLLSEGGIRHYAFDNTGFGGSIKISDGFTGSEKYTALRTNRNNAGVFDQDNDISSMISTGPHFLGVNDTLTVAFVMLAGDHLADLQSSAQNAFRNYYNLDDVTQVDDDNLSIMERFKIFPNPARETLSVSVIAHKAGQLVYSVSDTRGSTILTDKFYVQATIPTDQNIDISELIPGQYVITFSGEGFFASRSFIKLQ